VRTVMAAAHPPEGCPSTTVAAIPFFVVLGLILAGLRRRGMGRKQEAGRVVSGEAARVDARRGDEQAGDSSRLRGAPATRRKETRT
jgi:hypothetical protein